MDGKILVDAGTLGGNGFYLPFDPAGETSNYADNNDGNTRAGQGWEKTFDGKLPTAIGEDVHKQELI